MRGPASETADRGRGQAFSLEGFVAAAVLIGTVGLSLQIAVAPPESGTQDRPGSLQTQADDILRSTASSEDGLPFVALYWDPLRQRFAGANDRTVGYGNGTLPTVLFGDRSAPVGQTGGGAFAQAFDTRGLTYNIILVYHQPNTTAMGQEVLVYRGAPTEEAVAAHHTLTLYDSMRLTGPGSGTRTLGELTTNESNREGRFYPIPDVSEGPVYNVVEIRVTVW
jgi:hypothetical protein